MAISWQTGEPTCGKLIIEYTSDLYDGETRQDVAFHVGENVWRLDGRRRHDFTILRWSTLDDDRAAKAMGALEKMLSDDPWQWFCLDTTMGSNMFEASRYTDDGESQKVEAPTLIEAIEKLTENGNGLQGD